MKYVLEILDTFLPQLPKPKKIKSNYKQRNFLAS